MTRWSQPLSLGSDAGIGLETLKKVVLDVGDLKQLRYLMVEQLQLLPTNTRGHNADVGLGPTEQLKAVFNGNVELGLRELSLHASRIVEPAPLSVVAAQKIGMTNLTGRQALEERDDMLGLDAQETIAPSLLNIPVV